MKTSGGICVDDVNSFTTSYRIGRNSKIGKFENTVRLEKFIESSRPSDGGVSRAGSSEGRQVGGAPGGQRHPQLRGAPPLQSLHRVQVGRAPPAEAAERAGQRVLERVAEVSVEIRVDDRVQRRIEIPGPEHDDRDDVRALASVAQGRGDVVEEEGQPAEDEGAHDDAERARRLVLALHLQEVAVLGGRGGVGVQRAVLVGRVARRPVHEHGVAGARVQRLLLPVGLLKDGQVREDHDGARDPERDRTGDDGVRLVHLELALVRVLVLEVVAGGVPAHEDGHVRDRDGAEPCRRQHHIRHLEQKEQITDRYPNKPDSPHRAMITSEELDRLQLLPFVSFIIAITRMFEKNRTIGKIILNN